MSSEKMEEERDVLGMNEDWGEDEKSGPAEDEDDEEEDNRPDEQMNANWDNSSESSGDIEARQFSLHNAVEAGDLEKVNDVVKEHMELPSFVARAQQISEMPDDEEARRTVMAQIWHKEHIGKLFSKRDNESCTPLHVAIYSRQLECMKLLLAKGAKLTAQCNKAPVTHVILGVGSIKAHREFSLNALKLALAHQIDLALEDPLDLGARDDLFRTVLHVAAEFNLPDHLEAILSDQRFDELTWKRRDLQGRTAAHIACQVKSDKVLEITIRSHPEIVAMKDHEGMTSLHVAAISGFTSGISVLLTANADLADMKDARGRTAMDWAVLHNHVSCIQAIEGKPIVEDEVKGSTLILSHEVCSRHYTCPPNFTKRRGMFDVPPENVNRLKVLLDADMGILRSERLESNLEWAQASRANIADVLRVHDYSYIEKLQNFTKMLGENEIGELDGDTSISGLSFEAALFAAGSVCDAIDAVCAGKNRNAFCAVRPPGHHAGPRGVVTCKNDPNGSYGFCLLSNAAIGAAYARNVHRLSGVKKVAIVDFDVHHGNGTEACVRNLLPSTHTSSVESPFCDVKITVPTYKPWLNEQDGENVFFASIHGYGKRVPGLDPDPHAPPRIGMFYPSDGQDFGYGDFETAKEGEPSIVDVGQNSKSRMEWRSSWRKHVLPALATFEPDLIIISAGFDAHKEDDINMGYISALEHDYYWLTNQLVRIANKTAKGRLVSILEGGYKIQGKVVSPFARSVCSHVAALVESTDAEMYDPQDAIWEQSHEDAMVETAKQLAAEKERQASLLQQSSISNTHETTDDAPMFIDGPQPARKRSRRETAPVDYKALNDQLDRERAQAKLAKSRNPSQ